MVVWNDFDDDRTFYEERGFYDYVAYYFARRTIDRNSIPKIAAPDGIEVRHHPMKAEEEQVSYRLAALRIGKQEVSIGCLLESMGYSFAVRLELLTLDM